MKIRDIIIILVIKVLNNRIITFKL